VSHNKWFLGLYQFKSFLWDKKLKFMNGSRKEEMWPDKSLASGSAL